MTAENDNLPVHEDKQRGVYVKNLSEFYVGNSAEVYEIMRQGGSARAVSSTSELPFTSVRGPLAVPWRLQELIDSRQCQT